MFYKRIAVVIAAVGIAACGREVDAVGEQGAEKSDNVSVSGQGNLIQPTGQTPSAVDGGNDAVVMSRKEFEALVIGKTPEEVVTAVGSPLNSMERYGMMVFYYRERTVDPYSGKPDWQVAVWFKNGSVTNVNF